jgi:hypothetical protein
VKAFPCGTEPYISTVNFDPGQTAANLAMVQLPPNNQVCFTTLVPTHLIVDVSGWYAPAESGGVGYTTISPERVLDTRTSGPLQSMQEFRFSLAGKAGFPTDATAALTNLTTTNTAAPGYVRVYPCGEELDVSNVNYAAGQTVANLAAVKVAAGGDVCFRSYAQADIVVDLAGWYSPAGTAAFVAASPARLFDTRSTAGMGRLAPMTRWPSRWAGPRCRPASSVALNVTAAAPDAAGYIAVPLRHRPVHLERELPGRSGGGGEPGGVKLPADGRICFSHSRRPIWSSTSQVGTWAKPRPHGRFVAPGEHVVRWGRARREARSLAALSLLAGGWWCPSRRQRLPRPPPVAEAGLQPGEVGPAGLPSLTNFVFLPGTNNMLATASAVRSRWAG